MQDNRNCINIGYFTGDHKGHCGYCNSNNSFSQGFCAGIRIDFILNRFNIN